MWPAIAAAFSFALIALGVIIYVTTDYGRIKIIVDGPKADVQVDGEQIVIKTPRESITLRAGTHELAVKWGDGEFKTRTFVVRRGGNEELRVEYEPRASDRASTNRQTTPSTETASSETEVSIEAFNSRGAFVRHRDGRGFIDPILAPPDRCDARFKKVPGLADSEGVSFESTNYPGTYLRHRCGRLILTGCPEPLDRLDATFLILKGLAYDRDGWISLELLNYPGHFLQIRNGELWTAPRQEGAEFQKSATFRFVEAAPAPPSAPNAGSGLSGSRATSRKHGPG
jgi:hypothetical protein